MTLGHRIKIALNGIRSLLLFRVRYPWVKTGVGIHCQWTTRFWSPHRHIVLGDHVGIGHGCLFQADTELGNKVMIACNVAFLNNDDHRYDLVGRAMWDSGRGDKFTIVVEDDVWIGHGAIVLSYDCGEAGCLVRRLPISLLPPKSLLHNLQRDHSRL